MSGDIRKDFIIATIGNYFLEPLDRLKKLYSHEHLNDFLDAPRSTLICARKLPSTHEIILDVAISIDDDDKSIILFFKISPDPITPENMQRTILISTMVDSPVASLYHVLSTVFMPTLMKNSKWSQNFDQKTTNMMVNLEKTLAKIVRHQTSLNSDENVISSLDKEEHFWEASLPNARTRDEAAAAENILEIVKGINIELKSIVDWTSGSEIFENVTVSLMDLWNLGEKRYPEMRILQVINAIGNTLVQNIQESLKTTNAFSMPFHDFEKQVSWGISILSKTIGLCTRLTSEVWPNDQTRPFKGPKHIPHLVVNYNQRLMELERIRTVHRQLTLLLSVEEFPELKPDTAFAPFSGINPYLYNSYTEPVWQGAVSKFEKLTGPAEQQIANKLKSRLSKDYQQFDLLSEFKRYMELIERPKVSSVLRPNREALLLTFTKLMESFDQQLESRSFPSVSTAISTSEPVSNIYHLKHMKAKLKEIGEVADKVLSDLPNYPVLQEKIGAVSEAISSEEKRCFKDWSSDLLQALRRNEITLRKDDPVIEFAEGSRQMEVTYNGKLVQISEEAQQLLILGYRIPREVVDLVSEAKKFVRQAQQLDQIATFHNTIGDRMIPSQRPMMLETAVALSKMVQEQNGIVWSNTAEVDKYIVNLKQLVTSLARQNNQLSSLHIQIKERVMSLFETDLIKQQQKWKEILKQIRQIIKDVETQGYKNMKSWKNHWDRQLFKALEVQFLLSLSSINDNLPEVQAELVYRQGHLQFKPPLEELRQVYYGNIRKFLNIPNYFRGVSDDVPEAEQIFPTILKRHGHRFEKIYRDGEQLFSRLITAQARFVEWIALGSADIETLSKKYLLVAEDWDRNFRVSKNKGQEIIRLNCSDEKIGCFVVSFKLLRLEIELLNRKYWEILVTLLNNSIIQDMVTVERFLQDGIEKLKEDPQSVDEITKSNQTKERLALEMEQMKITADQIEAKNKTLVTWTKEIVDLGRMRSLWDQFQSLMENHQHIIGRQVENLKINLQSQARQVNNEMEHFKLRWDELKPVSSEATKNPQKFDETIAFLNQMKVEWTKLMDKQKNVAESCENLHVDTVEFPYIEQVDKDLASIAKTWEKLAEFREGFKEFEEEDWIIFRAKPYRFEEFLQKWDEIFRAEPKSDLIRRMLRDIESYSGIVQNIKFIRGDIFSEKHWYELYSLLEMSSKPLGQLKVGDFLQAREKIPDKLKDLKELNTRASGEIVVQQALNELDGWEIEAKFSLIENTDSQNRTIPIIQDFKTVLNKLGDNQSLLQSIRTSPFYSNFADRIAVWETRLADIDEYLQSLNKIQRRWVYLEPIFSHGVLETEQQRFRRIDDDFRLIMDKIKSDSRVVNLCKISGIRNRLNMLLDQLARCQSSLNEFLEKKRSGFPRFYFIGDDDLLEILGQSTKPAVIQAHLKKLFAGIYNVEFDANEEHITAMKSLEGEVVPLKSKVRIVPNVEEWLSELSNEMKYTLKSSLLDCISDVKHHSRDLNLGKYPAQILCLGNSIVFTERCEEAVRSGRLQDYLNKLKDELHFYTNYSRKESATSDDDGEKVLELKLKDLILDIIHEMDVVEYLVDRRPASGADWSWQKQLRFYIRDDGSAVVRMADAEFLYSYEYQGNAPKLVHTPLTDKCYLTLTQGMRMGLGGNPYGPAGTGKTESVKALGALMGRQVLVFNCDEGIDVKAMGRIFIGLCKCGAWGCFDEFNRLEGATLSAVSMQIQPIQTALKGATPNVTILDELVPLDPNAGIFVTLNPAGKGYGGRNKLPDNLKQLFRPVVMSQPDNERIAEVILYTEGYKGAKKMGKKLVEIFNLAGRLLTPQTHYDWGLRALKTVLKGCGTALKEGKQESGGAVGEKEENDIVVSTLRLNTLPKLTHADCFRFDNLIKDVFPNARFTELGHTDLTEKVKEACAELKLSVNESQVRKCLELYEQLQQRMGVVIVGPPTCGKSTVITLLKQALIKSGYKIKSHVINPKAMPRTHLLGHINLDTRQWTDGVLTMKAQQVYSEPQDVTSWIICDGDIDPEWVESLNSVLDDNRLLTLPSGWRIKFGPNVNFVFETHDLSYASPATISRMGMIFMSDEDADVKGIVETWLAGQAPEDRQLLSQIIEDHFYKGLKLAMQHEGQVQLPTVSVARNALSLMTGMKSVPQLAIAMLRGLGGHLSIQQAVEFSKEVFSWTQQTCPGIGRSINFYYNRNQDRVDLFQDDDMDNHLEFQFNQLPLVHTGNVKTVLDHIRPWLENQESFILIGPEGCGKSMILEAAFSELRSTEVATIHCSGLITPENVLQKLQQVCITISTNAGRVYKSKDGDRLILYFKGVNLVKPDKWGTCQLVEFLQQILSHDGFYDKNLEWVGIRGIQIVASISVGSSGGIYTLSPRFLSRLRVCTMSQPEPDQLHTICYAYLSSLIPTTFQEHPVSRKSDTIESLSQGMVTVYKEVRNAFTPVTQSHYQFTPRDLTKWVLGLMRYDLRTDSEAMNDLYNAWAFEGCRIFRDKLVSLEEKTKFDDTIISPVLKGWNMPNVRNLFEESCWISGPACAILNSSAKTNYSPLFGNILYKVGVEELITAVGKGMVAFGRENRELNIVVIPELLNNVAYIDRILSFPCSSLVLAGRAGVGRRTALSVVSALQRAQIITLKVGRNYSVKSFKNDLKAAIQLSAVEGNKVFLVVEDFQLVDKQFLDMLNSLLSSGEIPGLYSPEELETIIAMLRDNASAEGYNSSLYSYFALRVRRLLQIILIMDYTNENFVPNCQSNPAIYKQCSMIWLDNWTNRTLKMIPLSIIKKFYEKTDGDHTGFISNEQEKRQQFITAFKTIFQSLPEGWTYPRRYVTLIHNYAMLYNQKRVKIVTQVEKLKAGVSKLNEAKAIVEKLKGDAAVQEVTLAEKQSEANKALEMITITMKSANMQRGEMEVLKEKTLQENEVLLEQKKSIDAELKEIEPMVQMAKSAVGSIKNEALSEIRSLRAPPDVIRDILEGVLRLMGIRDMSWNSMKTFLAKRGVKDDIRNFDARHIHPEDREAVDKLLKFKAESFDPKYAKRASAAAAPLAEWVIANVMFSRVLEKIEPLENKQRLLEDNLRLAESQMEEISSELMSVDERVQQLKAKLNQYTKEAAEIEFHLSKAKATLTAAEGLVGKLDDEFGRWKEELQELDLELDDLPMYSLLAAAFITYLCDAPEDVRVEYLSTWTGELNKGEFDFCRFLSSERDLLQWQALGLPSDRLSQENAIMIFQTCSRPYLIDPSSRATEWLKNFMSLKRPPTVISLQHPNFQNELELAVRFGKILIVQEVDTIEPILVPILRGDLVSQGSREVVQIADKIVDYNPDFRLFLCTRTPNPILNPDAAAVLTVVNFTTTRAGLTSQLLSTTLSFEKPEIETKKKELVKNIESLKIELSKLGESLLQELASAQGNILENQELLDSLNKTKASSLAITESLKESSQLEESLNNEISDYLPFAEFGSCLYFAIIDTSKLNNMYQFSLTAFAGLFEKALRQSQASGDLNVHINQLKKSLESLVYEYVCRSLFKADRLAFALHLAHAMHQEYFQDKEWEAFTGQLVTDFKGSGTSAKDTVPGWIDEDRTFPVYLLSLAFPPLFEKFNFPNESLWQEFYTSTECEEHIPHEVRGQVSNFQKLMLIQTLRPDRLHTVMSDFARAVLGRKALFPPPTNMRQIVKETVATEPILILVSAGADPSSEMRELAHAAVGSQRYIEISMGQGQIGMALEKMKQGAQVGHWICMKNLHLVVHWLDTLEKEIKALTPHENFRLWLTSEPHPGFPKILLQTCLKIAYEAPPGLKKNLQRTYGGWTPQYVVGDKNVVRTQSLFVLALFHAVVQERRTYIPQGWSKFYEFNESDLRAGADVLDQLFKGNRSRDIQWPYVHGLFEQAIYGGRIDNDYDLRVLISYLGEYFNEGILTGANPSRKTVGPSIKLPNSTDIQEYYRLIESMPEYDRPSSFGLPSNIERSWQRIVSTQVIGQLKTLSRRFSDTVKFDKAIWHQELTPLLNLWKKLNQGQGTMGILQQKLQQPDMSDTDSAAADPIEAFVKLEYYNVVSLMQQVHRTLGNMSKVIRGILVPSEGLVTVADSLLKRETPQEWLKKWEGPLDTMGYLQGVVTRAIAIQKWKTNSKEGSVLRNSVDLSDLLNPDTFLSAFKQHCARKLGVAMDELVFVCAWDRNTISAGKLSCQVTGLLLEGCSFNGAKLVENTADSAPISRVGDCTISWMSPKDSQTQKKSEALTVPLYYNETRQKLIGSLEFPAQADNSKWIQAGVALFLKN